MPRSQDFRNYTARYNTKLTPEQEAAFSRWVWDQSQKLNRSVWNDLYDYDLRGFFAQGGNMSGGHLPDTFKKPNHPTFSDQSMYSGVDGYIGGQWQKLPTGQWSFVPGPTSMYSLPELQQYFQRIEPGNRLGAR